MWKLHAIGRSEEIQSVATIYLSTSRRAFRKRHSFISGADFKSIGTINRPVRRGRYDGKTYSYILIDRYTFTIGVGVSWNLPCFFQRQQHASSLPRRKTKGSIPCNDTWVYIDSSSKGIDDLPFNLPLVKPHRLRLYMTSGDSLYHSSFSLST